MNRTIVMVLAALFTGLPVGFAAGGREVMRDPSFADGFALSPLSPQTVQKGGGFAKTNLDTLRFDPANTPPVWQLAQWHSRHNLAKTPPVRGEDGSVTYANQGKKVTRYPDGTLLLEITTTTEYDAPRVQGEDWPHLLIKQHFEKPVNVGRAKRLEYGIEVRLVHCENRMKEDEFQTSLHTAQAPFFFILRNTNRASADFNESIWLGIMSFDYRYPQTRDTEKIKWNVGTKKYIYNIPETAIWGNISFHDMEWHRASLDILPLVERAVEAMHSKGVFLHTELSDLELTDMNFGWEVPGTFDAGVMVRGISLITYEKSINHLKR